MVELPQGIMDPISDAIDRVYADTQKRRFPRSISPSQLNHPCERRLWYLYRWVAPPEQFEGRILRLFDTGHREEARMIEDLRKIGVEIIDKDMNTGKQIKVTAVDGHLNGRLDGIAWEVPGAPSKEHVLECKTHNDKSFKQLVKHGVAHAKPDHMAQMQIYMHLSGHDRALYVAKNKNDDDYYTVRIHYNADHANALMAKAERIKEAKEAPAKIADDPQSFQCRFCHLKDQCHHEWGPLVNCRTCLHSSPVSGGNWFCERHQKNLSWEDQEAGCPNHLFLPSLIPGEQIDADPAAETVTYRLHGGGKFVDGPKKGAIGGG